MRHSLCLWLALALLFGGAAFLCLAALAWRFHRVDPDVATARVAPVVRAPWREVLAAPYAQLMGAVVLGLSTLAFVRNQALTGPASPTGLGHR